MANAKESGKQLNDSKDKGRGDDDDGLLLILSSHSFISYATVLKLFCFLVGN